MKHYAKLKWFSIALSLLFFVLFITPAESLPQNVFTIPSNGIVIDGIKARANEMLWGAVVSNTAWGSIDSSSSYRYGSYFSKTQINLMHQNGATALRIMLDKAPWDANDVKNIYSVPYKDYIKQLVTESHNAGIKVILDLTRDSSMGEDFDTGTAKAQVITTPSLRTAWINWGEEVVSYCKPDAIGIMNEPRGDVSFDYYYNSFLTPSINAYRSVDSDVNIVVMSMPFYSVENFAKKPIDDAKVLYEFHIYYYCPMSNSGEYYKMACEAYGTGKLSEAKNCLFKYFDAKFSGIPTNRIIFGEFGPYEFTDATWVNGLPDETRTPNWDAFLQDVYNYAQDRELNGAFQYSIGFSQYLMLDPRTDYTTFTPYGAVWAHHQPI